MSSTGVESRAQAEPFYLTTAIDYTNGDPHFGHAYEKVTADAIARYQRLRGREVALVLGADEHSYNVARAAREAGLEPKAYCDRMAERFRATWDRLGITYTDFMQTSDPRHEAAVRTFVQRIYDNGHVYRSTYRGLYCRSCEAFYTERDLVDGRCPWHDEPVETVEEPNWFFRLSAFRDRLRQHLLDHPGFVEPESRRNEVLSLLQAGLEDLSISRAHQSWGVRVPWDESQVVYVWFDALITYVSAIGFGWDEARFRRLWPARLHLIGKDITRFHAVVWPAMLWAAGLALPEKVFVHGFWYCNGQRFSKSLGNVIDPHDLVAVYGRDGARHYLVAETPFGQDGNFTDESIRKRVTSDLANDLGNLLHRTTRMIERYRDGRVPDPGPGRAGETELARLAERVRDAYEAAMEELRLHDAVGEVMRLVRRANKAIDEWAPWALARDPAKAGELDRALYALAETLRLAALLLSPVLVDGSPEIWRQLGIAGEDPPPFRWEDAAWGRLAPGTAIRRGLPVYPRLDPATTRQLAPVRTQSGRPAEAAPAGGGAERPAAPADGAHVSYDDFARLDLRVGLVLAAEAVAGSEKLLRLRVKVGEEIRQIVAGIREQYRPEELPGRRVVVVANLAPRRIFGIESQGMLLAAEGGGRLALVVPERDVDDGSRVK
ncbi:MAG: methionine--tRNA ligase [Clostridia bacterium]|nr:methionine--tRNA ligase [Clostridia bacterium]